jgi:DNA-directed RNA polymerase subunit RPC12/RpoP
MAVSRVDELLEIERQAVYSDDALWCPHCHHRHDDPEEFFGGRREDTEVECDECGVKFFAGRRVSVSYVTRPILKPKGE